METGIRRGTVAMPAHSLLAPVRMAARILHPLARAALPLAFFCLFLATEAETAETSSPANANSSATFAGNSAVRSTTDFVRQLIDQGFRRSPTFRHEVLSLEGSDLIVIIEPTGQMPPGITGYLTYVTTAQSCRIVRILFDMHRAPTQAIAIIGHELQHAIEVATHPEVVSAETLRAMYERIGWRNHRTSQGEMFDSAEAITAGHVILGELIAGPPPVTATTDSAGR